MLKKLIKNIFLTALALGLINCSDANFNGNDQDTSLPSAVADSEVGNDPFDQTPIVDPPPSADPLPQESTENLIYQVFTLNSGLSFDTVHVDIHIATSSAPILLFLHLQQPTVIHLKGGVASVDAVFLTANTNLYDLPSSEVRLPDNSIFPSTLTATGFFPTYSAGNGLRSLIGESSVAIWEQGVEVSGFAASLGEKKCFYHNFDSDRAPPTEFPLVWSDGQTCLF